MKSPLKNRVRIAGVLSSLLLMNIASGAEAASPRQGPDVGPPPAPALPLATLLDVAQTALASCSAAGAKVAVTIMDSDGVMRMLLRADNSATILVDISRRKAYTVVKTGMSTADFAATLPPEVVKQPESLPVNGDPNLIARAGGLPIMVNGRMMGAIGVSGRARGGDVDCANAGLTKVPGTAK